MSKAARVGDGDRAKADGSRMEAKSSTTAQLWNSSVGVPEIVTTTHLAIEVEPRSAVIIVEVPNEVVTIWQFIRCTGRDSNTTCHWATGDCVSASVICTV